MYEKMGNRYEKGERERIWYLPDFPLPNVQ